jgi:hypothetical protein
MMHRGKIEYRTKWYHYDEPHLNILEGGMKAGYDRLSNGIKTGERRKRKKMGQI